VAKAAPPFCGKPRTPTWTPAVPPLVSSAARPKPFDLLIGDRADREAGVEPVEAVAPDRACDNDVICGRRIGVGVGRRIFLGVRGHGEGQREGGNGKAGNVIEQSHEGFPLMDDVNLYFID